MHWTELDKLTHELLWKTNEGEAEPQMSGLSTFPPLGKSFDATKILATSTSQRRKHAITDVGAAA